MKLAVVGGGSTYTPELVDGLERMPDLLPVEELALADPDPERLAVVGGLAGRMLERGGHRARLTLTERLEEAVEGADAVLIQLRVGGSATRIVDEAVPVACGPPGAPRDGGTSVVEIAGTTRRDNLATFPRFGSLDHVPTHGVTVGLGTIASSRAVQLVLHGADKREATARLLALDRFDPTWPASIVHEHADAQILVDREALP